MYIYTRRANDYKHSLSIDRESFEKNTIKCLIEYKSGVLFTFFL